MNDKSYIDSSLDSGYVGMSPVSYNLQKPKLVQNIYKGPLY